MSQFRVRKADWSPVCPAHETVTFPERQRESYEPVCQSTDHWKAKILVVFVECYPFDYFFLNALQLPSIATEIKFQWITESGKFSFISWHWFCGLKHKSDFQYMDFIIFAGRQKTCIDWNQSANRKHNSCRISLMFYPFYLTELHLECKRQQNYAGSFISLLFPDFCVASFLTRSCIPFDQNGLFEEDLKRIISMSSSWKTGKISYNE